MKTNGGAVVSDLDGDVSDKGMAYVDLDLDIIDSDILDEGDDVDCRGKGVADDRSRDRTSLDICCNRLKGDDAAGPEAGRQVVGDGDDAHLDGGTEICCRCGVARLGAGYGGGQIAIDGDLDLVVDPGILPGNLSGRSRSDIGAEKRGHRQDRNGNLLIVGEEAPLVEYSR